VSPRSRRPAAEQVLDLPELSVEREISDLTAHEIIERCRITGSADDLDATGLDMHEVEWLRVSAPSVKLGRCQARHVRLAHCELSGAVLTAAALKAVEILDCRITGGEAAEVTIGDAIIERCRLDWLNLRFARLHDIVLRDCVLTDVDLGGARLENVRFERCDLSGAQFGQARFKQVDMRGCVLDRIGGIASMGGVIITSDQLLSLAPALAAATGLVIRDHEPEPEPEPSVAPSRSAGSSR
jgi:uncharacterized protein YjbI with pentapeptide repeats